MKNVIQDVVSNLKSITKVEIKDMFDDEWIKGDMVEKTLKPIQKYIKSKFKIEMTDDMLYQLDEELFSKF